MSGMPDQTPRQYLLRRLPADEADRFEERILADDECADQLRDAENDLLDDYAAGHLTSDERDAVERYLLQTPVAQQRVRFAQALADAARQRNQTPGSAPPAGPGRPSGSSIMRNRFLPLGVLVAASVGFILLALQLSRAPAPPADPPVAGAPEAPPAAAPGPPASPPAQATPYALLLLAEVRRGADGAQRVSIPADAEQVRLQLEVTTSTPADDTAAYQIAVQASDGQELFAAASLASRLVGAFRIVEAVIPARVLGTGGRRVALRRAADNGPLPVFEWEIDVRAGGVTP